MAGIRPGSTLLADSSDVNGNILTSIMALYTANACAHGGSQGSVLVDRRCAQAQLARQSELLNRSSP